MARTYLYPLIVLLIVFALRLDFNEAAEAEVWPPVGYRTRCLLVAEVVKLNGIYRYDPDESQRKGFPKMVKLRDEPGKKLNFHRVNKKKYISYTERSSEYALRFSMGNLRFVFDVKHPCNENTGTRIHWKIVKDVEDAPLKGYVQITNEIVAIQCVPRHGLLTSNIKYDLPMYDGFKTAYSCVTWLKENEDSTGVWSDATAAQVDPHTKRCTLFYKSHSDFTESSGDNNYCLLEEFVPPEWWADMPDDHSRDYPGFYPGCRIHVEDPVFAGRWALDFSRSFNWMPYLYLWRAPLSGIFQRHYAIMGGKTPGYLARLNGNKLQFLKDGAVGLEFKLRAHICIGPDTRKLIRTETAGQISVAYRRDGGMRCVPFYINVSFIQESPNTKSVTLDGHHTLERCQDHMNTEFADRDWRIVTTVHDDGPCYAFERGSEFLARVFNVAPNTYSCFY